MINETHRKIIELAIEAGRSRQSEQTKFVHHHHLISENGHHDTIPVYENFLFVLALLKSRKTDYIVEAKALLERLFFYQNCSEDHQSGNFPIYLHETPSCYNRWLGAKVLAPLYWIYHHFHQILGDILRGKSVRCLKSLCHHCLSMLRENPADYLTTLQIAAGTFSVGRMLNDHELEQAGSQMMDDLLQMGPQPIWFSTKGIADILTALQMVYEKISESPWVNFWNHVEATWHPSIGTYCGPVFDEMQSGLSPEISLYDYFLSMFSETISPRLSKIQFVQLQAVLIQQTEDKITPFVEKSRNGAVGSTEWFCKAASQYTYSLIAQHHKMEPQLQKGFHPFYLQWVHNDKHYSLVCSGGRFSKVTHQSNADGIDLFFTLPDPIDSDHPLENRELLFYCNAHDDVKITVEGSSATTFKMGENVQINSSCVLSLKFELHEGDGAFVGHLIPGNRPSQLLVTKRAPCQACDKQIFLRTLRKKQPCTIRVSLNMSF